MKQLKKICKCCGCEFTTTSNKKLYCDNNHYLPCPVCGKLVIKTDRDFSKPARCCSDKCRTEQRALKFAPKRCKLCGQIFVPTSGDSVICNGDHWGECEVCGGSFKISKKMYYNRATTCSRRCSREKLRCKYVQKYGVDHPMQSEEVKKKRRVTLLIRNNVLADSKCSSQKDVIAQCIADLNIAVCSNKVINGYLFDYFLPTHDVLLAVQPSADYTSSKVKSAYEASKSASLRCIQIFDWDNASLILQHLRPPIQLDIKDCKIYKLTRQAAISFLKMYHSEGASTSAQLFLGTVYNNKLIQVMSFAKANDNIHSIELTRLCTLPGYEVIGGYRALFEFATYQFFLEEIVAFDDLTKSNSDVLEEIGMHRIGILSPRKIWSRGSQIIIDDRLDKDEMSLQGWKLVTDCGRDIYEY